MWYRLNLGNNFMIRSMWIVRLHQLRTAALLYSILSHSMWLSMRLSPWLTLHPSPCQVTECATAASATVKAAGRGTTATAAAAPTRACRTTASCAAIAGGASAATASAPCQERLATSVNSARRAGTPVALQGESALAAAPLLQWVVYNLLQSPAM